MTKFTQKIIATVLVVGASIGVVFLIRADVDYKNVSETTTLARAKSKGNPNTAEVKIIEYVDFQCGACAAGTKVLNEYFKKYPEKIYIELRHYPASNIHFFAGRAALYADCAAQQGKFWQMHDLLFQEQSSWSKVQNVEPQFHSFAQQIKLDLEALDVCLKSDEVRSAIIEEKKTGALAGVQYTPAYFINGQLYVGYKPLGEQLKILFPEEKS